jgi:hypothetical protein
MVDRPSVGVRAASVNDRRTVWDWRNNFVCQDLYKPNGNVTFDQFAIWYDRALKSTRQTLLVGHVHSLRMALVWCQEQAGNEWAIDVFLKPGFCGKGVLSNVLAEVAVYLRNKHNAALLKACIPHINPAAAYAFEQCGFECQTIGRTVNCVLKTTLPKQA